MPVECKQCGSEFKGDGRNRSFCHRSCRIDYHNGLWKKYGEASRQKSPASGMLRSARHRSKRDNLPFNLTIDDIVIPELCPVFGFPLQFNAGTGSAKYNSPSLDKIIPALGYVKGNVQVLSHLANTMKHDATPEQLVAFGEWAIQTYSKEK